VTERATTWLSLWESWHNREVVTERARTLPENKMVI